MSASSHERVSNLPLSEQVFTDEYWGYSEPCKLISLEVADNRECHKYAQFFKDTVHRIRDGLTSPLDLPENMDFADFYHGTIIEFDFESLVSEPVSPSKSFLDYMGTLFSADTVQHRQNDDHLDWKIGCTAEELIRITNRAREPRMPLKPGMVTITQRFKNDPKQWTYTRTAWYGILMPTKSAGKSDLFSFSYLPRLRAPSESALNELVPTHRPLAPNSTTHSVYGDNIRIEHIKQLRAYPPARAR